VASPCIWERAGVGTRVRARACLLVRARCAELPPVRRVSRWTSWAETALLDVSIRMCRRATLPQGAGRASQVGGADCAAGEAPGSTCGRGHAESRDDDGGGCGGRGGEARAVQEYIRAISACAEGQWVRRAGDRALGGVGSAGGGARFPTFVINLPARSDRRLHMRKVRHGRWVCVCVGVSTGDNDGRL
jgi:hypothetical protein